MSLIDQLLFSDKVPKMMKKSLDFQAARHLLISSNIGNLDTPGYISHDISFQDQLREVMGGGGTLKLRTTNAKHFGPSAQAIKNLTPQPFEEANASKSNGNNVNIDEEMAKLAENQIRYNAVTQMMMKRGSTIRSAVTELPQQ